MNKRIIEKITMNFMACDAEYKDAKIVLFGAPFDGTVSYRPGARFGPSAIRGESYGIETYSPYLERDLEELSVCDAGDLELPFGSCRKALDIIGEFVFQTVNDGKFPLMTGGEHLVSLGAVEALSQTYPDLHILHFDAHADLREDYLGDTLSHACVLRRCHEILGDDRIVQLGIRSMTAQERAWAKVHVIQYPFDFSHLEDAIKKLCGVPVYLTLDLDVLDPAFFPGTGTPEPGGVSYLDLQWAIHQMGRLNLVGADMVELAPMLDASGGSTITACKLLRELLLTLAL